MSSSFWIHARLWTLISLCLLLLLSTCAFAQPEKNDTLKQRYADPQTGVTFDYYVMAGWKKVEQSKPPTTRVIFSNPGIPAAVAVTYQETPDVPTIDLSQPGVFEAIVQRMQREAQIQALTSSRMVTNKLNGVKGIELVYPAPQKGIKAKAVTFFKGHKVYIVDIIASDSEFERVDKVFADVIVQTLNF